MGEMMEEISNFAELFKDIMGSGLESIGVMKTRDAYALFEKIKSSCIVIGSIWQADAKSTTS